MAVQIADMKLDQDSVVTHLVGDFTIASQISIQQRQRTVCSISSIKPGIIMSRPIALVQPTDSHALTKWMDIGAIVLETFTILLPLILLLVVI
jgi:hypothetical protein